MKVRSEYYRTPAQQSFDQEPINPQSSIEGLTARVDAYEQALATGDLDALQTAGDNLHIFITEMKLLDTQHRDNHRPEIRELIDEAEKLNKLLLKKSDPGQLKSAVVTQDKNLAKETTVKDDVDTLVKNDLAENEKLLAEAYKKYDKKKIEELTREIHAVINQMELMGREKSITTTEDLSRSDFENLTSKKAN